MRIIIVGCGKVGSALAEQLSAEGHDLTLIDLSERRLEELTNRLDLTAVAGSGTSYQVLLEAGRAGHRPRHRGHDTRRDQPSLLSDRPKGFRLPCDRARA